MTRAPIRFAVLTPPGAAAVATVGVAGPRAWEIVRRLFRPAATAALPPQPDHDRFTYGQFGGPPGDAVVVAARSAALGDWVEVHCHGGTAMVRMIAAELVRAGAVSCASGDLRVGTDAASHVASATLELTRAPTLRTAAILLDQAAGAFDLALTQLNHAVTAGDLFTARKIADDLAAQAALGRHLTRAWRIAVVGAPNVGKSSLVNALAGYRRSVVTEIAGTTRDLVVTQLAIDGWPVELIDTAGQHRAADLLEEQGIELGLAAAANADLCVCVADVETKPFGPRGDTERSLLVINKSDLPAAWDVSAIRGAILVSAQTGTGLPELCGRISQRLAPTPPAPGAAVPYTVELADKAVALRTALNAGDLPGPGAIFASLGHPLQSVPAG